MVAKGSPDWLPAGWTVQFRVLKTGRRVQIYVNLETGQKFFSKDDAVHHIKMGYTLHGKPQSTNRLIERHPGKNPLQGLVNGKDTNPEWLPNGWKVELKTRQSGLKIGDEYKCYVDPLNRRKFYSKPEVFRYLRTIKHKSGMFEKKTGIRVHSPNKPSSEAKRHTLKHPTTRRQIFSGKTSSGMSDLSKIEGSKQLESKRTSPEATVASALRAEIVQDSLANEIQDCAETKQNGALNRSPWSKAGGHKISQGKRSKLPETEECKKTQGKADVVKGLASTPAPDILPEKNSIPLVMENKNFRKPQMTTGRSKDKKFLNLPRRSSKRLAASLQRDQVVNLMSGEQGLSSIPTTDVLLENNSIPPVMEKKSFKKPQMTSSRSKDKKFLNLPRRSSKRLSGLQPDQVVNLMSGEQGLASTPTADILQEKNSIPPVMEKKSFRKHQMTSSRSKDKKILILPHRSSKRLAGLDPDNLVNSMSGERAREFSIGKSSKTGAILDACLTSDSMVDGGSTQHEFGQEKELECHASTGTSTPLYGDSANKSTIPTEDQVAPEEQKQKLESGKMENEKPEPHFSFLFESDPCLEFAFKTLTGELPVADAADDWATLITEPGMLQHENLHESGIKRSSDETDWVNLKKSKKKKVFILPCRSSKRLAGLEPELVANSLAGEGFLEDTVKKSHKNNDPPATDSADEVIEQLWAVPETVPANYFSTNINTSTHTEPSNEQPIAGQRIELGNHFSVHADTSPEIELSLHEAPSDMQLDRGQGIELSHYFSNEVDISTHAEPSNKSEKSVEDPLIPEKQPHTQAQMGDLEKPEPELAFSLGDCWSDPCLDFAFKTLTGAIPIEDNLVQGYFQEQLETTNNHKNGSLALPDFGSPGFFQSDISSHFDSPEKSVSGQQLSMNSSFLPPGNVSLPSCSGAHHSQQHCLEGDKDLRGKGPNGLTKQPGLGPGEIQIRIEVEQMPGLHSKNPRTPKASSILEKPELGKRYSSAALHCSTVPSSACVH
ncbi:hypothetical protein FNV43_RR09245 [Rhamnella rubrinervis]|uniref:MBD domain-containing protein n=1 Tax=Rhamnella rubrinervis TaxID=2594499 RepID=A0A8K0H9M6_9ROSA|nr:hypothetical protein FNV43_RR09245 [Rhamnella rubrinervis]